MYKSAVLNRVLAVALLCATMVTSAHAAATLDTWVGVVGGGGNGSIPQGCTTFGAPASLSFFTFNGFAVPQGGIAACGYSGTVTQTSAASGPLTQSGSLAPVILGNPGFAGSYDGTAAAVSNYGRLGATAHANISGGIPGSQVALFESVGAARFSDTLTVTSPLVVAGTAGSVRYSFSVDGQSTSLGAPGAYLFGDTYAVLDIQQNTGPVYEVMNAHVRRGDTGTLSNSPPPAGWSTSMGSLGGASTFVSLDLPMTWGTSWEVKVGLLAWAYGTADANFLSTARLTGMTFYNASPIAISNFALTAASGTDYVNAVPEPASVLLMLAGLGVLVWRVRRSLD
jgi:hypothetical protein